MMEMYIEEQQLDAVAHDERLVLVVSEFVADVTTVDVVLKMRKNKQG